MRPGHGDEEYDDADDEEDSEEGGSDEICGKNGKGHTDGIGV